MLRLRAPLRGLPPLVDEPFVDDFDDDYIKQMSTTTCPECGVKGPIGSLVVREVDNTRVLEV